MHMQLSEKTPVISVLIINLSNFWLEASNFEELEK